MGEGWRERLPKPRLGAIRRSAASLGPLLAAAAEPIDRTALSAITVPITLLMPDDASAVERGSIHALAAILPRARIQPVALAASLDTDWAPAIARTIASGRV
jgi:hypothetical protein